MDALLKYEKDLITELHISLDGLPLRSLPTGMLPLRSPTQRRATTLEAFQFQHLHHIELHSVRDDVHAFDDIIQIVRSLEA